MNNILDFEYKNVLANFIGLTKIPHGSGNMEPIANYIEGILKGLNADYKRDKANNFIIRKPASKGYENAPTVMIQGHLDMVCEKESDSKHDFEKDPLPLKFDGKNLFCDKTTLGGDDGIAVAYGLSLLQDENLVNPPLEIVFTTDEETGMFGAIALDTSELKAKYMINVDSEDEDIALVSCAGGETAVARIPIKYGEVEGVAFTINISGLKGGHSGTEIDKNRVNAVKLLARFLFMLERQLKKDKKKNFLISSIEGGTKDNAIPREACATIVCEKDIEDDFFNMAKRIASEIQDEVYIIEPSLVFTIKKEKASSYKVFSQKVTKNVIFLLSNSPNGVLEVSKKIEGLVESSCNLGILKVVEEEYVEAHFSVRSSVNNYKKWIIERICDLIEKSGGKAIVGRGYPAWEYKNVSKLREHYRNAHVDFYKTEPKFLSIHAGLECGILSGKMPELDMISIGPDLKDIHTPKERLGVESAVRLYKFIEELLKRIAVEG